MPSHLHEALLQLFRNRPLLASELLQNSLRVELPHYTDARIHSADLTEVQPAEYRADLVVVQLLRDRPVLGIVVEVQLSRDDRKKYAWPAYAINLRARLECPVHVLVVTPSEAVARWAAKPAIIGGDNCFTPLIIGPSGIPEIVDDDQAQADPEMAVLSTMAHGEDKDFTKAARIAAAAQRASLQLDTDRARLYFDLIRTSLSEAARRALRDMMPPNYEYQSDFARKYYGQGKAEGKAEGKTEGKMEVITKLLSMRFGPLDDVSRERLAAASSVQLEGISERLLTAHSLDEALGPLQQ